MARYARPRDEEPAGAIDSGNLLTQMMGNPEMHGEIHEMARHQVGHSILLIDDLLDVSRLDQGKIELRRSEVILDDMVARAITPARSQIDEKQHELTVSLPKRPFTFSADIIRVEQMLSDLLTNATNYSEPGKSIRLSAEVGGEELVFRVLDQGYGIMEEMLPKGFGLFTQVDATVNLASDGLGIGLSPVRILAEMHGGGIAAISGGRDVCSSLATMRKRRG